MDAVLLDFTFRDTGSWNADWSILSQVVKLCRAWLRWSMRSKFSHSCFCDVCSWHFDWIGLTLCGYCSWTVGAALLDPHFVTLVHGMLAGSYSRTLVRCAELAVRWSAQSEIFALSLFVAAFAHGILTGSFPHRVTLAHGLRS